jgi:putative ATP-binding cassette transporter
MEIDAFQVRLPSGRKLIDAGCHAIEKGESVLVTGPSGAGKSTMFRALGGIWPFGSGRITLPKDARVMIVPQKPYLPIGSLGSAVAFPAPESQWSRAELTEVLGLVGLGAFASRLDEVAHWGHMLSLGEQQRLAVARALLHKPDFLFLDEATASLDEPSEASLYRLMRERLPDATIVSIGHRTALKGLHKRHLTLVKEGESSRLVEEKVALRQQA